MKKGLLIGVLAAGIALAANAQVPFISMTGMHSLVYSNTGGLFEAPMDSCFDINPNFGSIAYPFILAGASGNPLQGENDSSLSSFTGGFYQPGSIPFSFYGSVTGTGLATALSADGTIPGYSNSTVGTTTYQWLSSSTTVDYKQPSALSSLDLELAGLFKIKGITTGLYFNQIGNWASTNGDSQYYASAVNSIYYDATPTGIPTSTLNYTTTISVDNIDSTILPAANTTVTIGAAGTNGLNSTVSTTDFCIPFAFATGKISHYGFAGLTLVKTDSSGSYSTLDSTHALVAGAINDRAVTIDSAVNGTTIAAVYIVDMPGFFMADKGSKFTAGLSISDVITSQTYAFDSVYKSYNGATAGTKTPVNGYHQVATATYDPGNFLAATAFAAHTLPLVSGDVLSFKISPTFALSFSTNGNTGSALSSSVRYTETLNSTFAYDNGTYHKYTTTVTGDRGTRTIISTQAIMYMGLEVKPEGWPFGFSIGAHPSAQLSWDITKGAVTQTVSKDETITAGAVTATTTTYTNSTTAGVGTSDFNVTFGEDHYFGIFIPLGDKLRLDIDMNGSNLLIFENLTMQICIPLGK